MGKRLKAIELAKLPAGMHGDGDGLYLAVSATGARSWVLRTVVRGRRAEVGLGGLSSTPLKDARYEAARLRGRARKGEDILAARRLERRKASVPSFEVAARAVHGEVAPTLRNAHNKVWWLRALELHAFPSIGGKPVDAIDAADVLRVVGPIWTNKPDMARKILARIRRVIDWATIRGYRNVMAGTITVPLPNPCAGVLSALPRQPAEGNHAALPYPALPEFVAAIPAWNTDLAVRLAVEFTILTAARTSETLLAKWSEIDIETRIWNVPAARMKMDRDHLVPLSQRAVAILKTAKDLNSEYVFPSPLDLKKPMSNVAMLRALQRAGYRDLTMHGFRATFRTWAAERTRADHLVIEACLAHKVQGIERHYLRTTFIERRRKLMDTWAAFATAAPAGKVVRIG